jgi:hypothetical protein
MSHFTGYDAAIRPVYGMVGAPLDRSGVNVQTRLPASRGISVVALVMPLWLGFPMLSTLAGYLAVYMSLALGLAVYAMLHCSYAFGYEGCKSIMRNISK